jgi:hypothetical protein
MGDESSRCCRSVRPTSSRLRSSTPYSLSNGWSCVIASTSKRSKLVRYEQNHDSDGARRKRRRIKQIGADIRDIDRMMHALGSRLLGARHEQQSN